MCSVDGGYGQGGNRLLEYVGLLWWADIRGMTAVLQPNDPIFKFFNLDLIKKMFCVTFAENKDIDENHKHELQADQAFYPKVVTKFLPEYLEFAEYVKTTAAIDRYTEIMMTFYAALYAGINKSVLFASQLFILTELKSVNYVAVHKRNFEGQCSWRLCMYYSYSDFPNTGFNKNSIEWSVVRHWGRAHTPVNTTMKRECKNFEAKHPLCLMSPNVIHGAIEAHKLSGVVNRVFLFTDHQLPFDDLSFFGAIFQKQINSKPELQREVDIILASHGALAVLNPYSTFSFIVYLLRTILGLDTSMIDRDSDMYTVPSPEMTTYRQLVQLVEKRRDVICSTEDMKQNIILCKMRNQRHEI